MLQSVEAVIDTRGRVRLLENIRLNKKYRAIVTILDDEQPQVEEISLAGSMELLDDDLESGSKQIAEMLNQAIEDSVASVNK